MQQSYVQQQLHKKNNPKENEVHMIERWYFLTARILPRECRVCSNTVALVDDPNTRFEECAEQIKSPAICCLPGCLPARKEDLHFLSLSLSHKPSVVLGCTLGKKNEENWIKNLQNVWRKKKSQNWKISRVWFAGLVCMLQQMKPLFFFFFLSIVLLQHRKISRSASLFWFLSWRKQKNFSSLLLLLDCFVAIREVLSKLLLSSDSCLEKNKGKTSHLLLSCLHDRVPTANWNTQSTTETGVKMMTSHKSKTKKMRRERERERVACYKIRLLHYYCSNEEEKHKLLEGGERNTWRRRR